MGLCFHDVRLMWNARMAGASFNSVLTIGRQSLYLHPSEADFFAKALALQFPQAAKLRREHCKFGVYAEDFLRVCIGAGTVVAMDYSAFEGAAHVHDMNQPVPETLVEGFDVVIDGGSLEHIFNFPVAVSNLMRMVKIGGRVFMSTPANNHLGHGFYQFSPELMFRVFAPENGFEICTVQLVEARYPRPEFSRNRHVYDVTDPAAVHRRVGLVTKRPVMMMVEAKKLEHRPLFVRPPLQSDYVTKWSEDAGAPTVAIRPRKSWRRAWLERVMKLTPPSLYYLLAGNVQLRNYSFSNRKFFRKVMYSRRSQ
jgi:SAM-dependent methyltransferase